MYTANGLIKFNRRERIQLAERYPYLKPSNADGTPHLTAFMHCLIGEYDLPAGWMKLFLQMCEDIREPLEQLGVLDTFRFIQVKEKYGAMRVYTSPIPVEITDIISKYEFLSEQICSTCGNIAEVNTTGYILPQCKKCLTEAEYSGNTLPIEVKTGYTVVGSREGQSFEYYVDATKEWTRYLESIGGGSVES